MTCLDCLRADPTIRRGDHVVLEVKDFDPDQGRLDTTGWTGGAWHAECALAYMSLSRDA